MKIEIDSNGLALTIQSDFYIGTWSRSAPASANYERLCYNIRRWFAHPCRIQITNLTLPKEI